MYESHILKNMNTWGMKIGDVMRKFGEVPVGVPTADPDDEPEDIEEDDE
jgi:hypothetical protein